MKTIKELRAENNMTQADLAKALETTKQDIKEWEQKQPDLAGGAIIKLAKFFDVTSDELLGVSNNKSKQVFIKTEKLEAMGSNIADINTDIAIIRAFSEGFERPSKLDQGELYASYMRAFKFFGMLHMKAQQIENELDDIAAILLESNNYDTLREYLTDDELIEIDYS